VNQQSEHLSNAQIEEYGSPASGAGAETEERVEQHLADCPSCRSRVLEFQRTRFALLPDPKVNTVSSSNCPCEEDLHNLAAGLSAGPLSAELTAHAAACSRCGPLLREYQEDFSDDVTPEEQTALAQLRSASPEWQQQKAREMLKQVRTPAPSPPSPRRIFSWKWVMTPAAAAAACALLALGIGGVTWYAKRDTPEKVDKLLVQASTEPRTIEMRWPGAAHSRLTVSLGPSDSQSPSLLEAKSAIAHALQKNSSNSAWLRLQAQTDILEHKPSPAIDVLKHELDAHPDSPSIALELAIAYFVQGQESDETQYKNALIVLDNLLLRQPENTGFPALRKENTVARFNRAIVREHLHMDKEAADDWNAVLQYETDAGWKTEAEQHLQRLQEKKTPG
jgi:anti-sigma factor RsiW